MFLEIVSEKSRYSLHQNMDKIKVPTQIIWGKQDQVCSECVPGAYVPVACSEFVPVPATLATEKKQEVIYQVSLTGWFLIPGGRKTPLGQMLVIIEGSILSS